MINYTLNDCLNAIKKKHNLENVRQPYKKNFITTKFYSNYFTVTVNFVLLLLTTFVSSFFALAVLKNTMELLLVSFISSCCG